MKQMNPKQTNQKKKTTDEWLTPPALIKSLGEFDLDPCSPIVRPWDTARNHFTILDNGLLKEWFGRVWLNPPYGRQLIHWLNRIALHGDGTCLCFARTDTDAFQQFVFPFADSILFLDGRLTFLDVKGNPGDWNGGAPSILIAYGENNSQAISSSGLRGHHLPVNRIGVVIVGMRKVKTWRMLVKTVFVKLGRPASIEELTREIEAMAQEKISTNQHYRAKIRQILQQHFRKTAPATYAEVEM